MNEAPADPRDNIRPVCPRFSEAFLNTDHRVFGIRMRPYSNWHVFLLRFNLSPIVHPELSLTPGDILLAARIGACRFGEWPASPPWWSPIRLRRLIAFRNSAAIAKEGVRLHAWMEDFAAAPDFWQEEKIGVEGVEPLKERGTAPPFMETVAKLIRCGFSEREAWEMPVGKARWYTAVFANQDGAGLDFVEPLSPAFEARFRREREEFQREKAEKAAREKAEAEAKAEREKARKAERDARRAARPDAGAKARPDTP